MNARTRILAFGAVAGALLGVLAGSLYLRAVSSETDDDSRERLPRIHPGQAIGVGLTTLTLLRQIVGLGQRG